MCGLAMYAHLDLSVFVRIVVDVQEGYALFTHGCCVSTVVGISTVILKIVAILETS